MNTICRTCLRSSVELLPLFEDTKLPHKIKTISSIEISDEDNLPKNVCAECIVNINLSFNFRRVIINSDLELHERCAFLHEDVEIEDNINDDNDDDVPSEPAYQIHIVKNENANTDIDNKQDEFLDGRNMENEEEVEDSLLQADIKVHDSPISTTENKPHDMNKNLEENKLNIEKSIMLGSHTVKRRKQKLYKCSKCDFKTTEYRKYRSHSQNHGVKICNICGKFISASNMTKHISIHTDPPIACEECGKVCKNTESLRGHLIIHKGINRKCKICGEYYKERAAYIAHIKSHKADEDKSVKCPLCDKRLYGKRGLKAHIRSHTGERPYPCEFCKKGFSSSHALKTHRRQHTNERPYKCALCPMAFPQKVSLRTHLKSKHQMGMADNS